ncbi:MAG TPA: hypothetical protein VGJ20_39445 [Xanthobacteraceae bacterium]
MVAQTPEAVATPGPSVQELQKEIRRRDALIENLARRVAALEKQVQTNKRGVSATARPAVARPVVARAVATAPVAAAPAAEPVAFSAEQTAQAPPPSAAPPPATPAPPPAPGQFEVSPEAAERALERTLAATGNLVVPSGFAEIEPLFSYTRRENSAEVLFNVNRNELMPALDARLGLPWESQIEVLAPWNFNEQQQTDVAVAPAQLLSDRWGNAFGDLVIGGAKTLTHESGWLPSLLGRVSWEAPTGPITSNGVPMVSGTNRLSFALTALKRQDPLVFVATGGYTRAFEANGINPGNQINFTTGAFLATSPETTLRTVLSQNFVQDVTVHGVTIPGSNTVQPILTFGASSILGRGILVDLQVGLGLTNTAPKYQVILSSTYRFGVTGQ